MHHYNFTETDDGENIKYIAEDWEAKMARNQKTAQWIQTAILHDLCQVLGIDAVIPEDAAKELILPGSVQWMRCMLPLCLLITL